MPDFGQMGSNIQSGLQNMGMSQTGASNAYDALKWGGGLGLGFGALSAMSGGGFAPGAMMGLLGGGAGSYLRNNGEEKKGSIVNDSPLAKWGLLGSLDDESKLSPSQKLMFTGANMMMNDPFLSNQIQQFQPPTVQTGYMPYQPMAMSAVGESETPATPDLKV